ncbi:MAG: hypothetical protein OXI88_22590 [Gammaproteobacteria bacterium]|nr:hypothetical protein [Gammaproteobacteria bacterium]
MFRENAWPWYQKLLIAAGENPLWVPFSLFVVVLLFSAVAWGYQAYYVPLTCGQPLQFLGSEGHFFTLWAIQATIAAIIYPIVIGFVTLLLQRRHSAKASLQIYLHDSAAALTGMSALFLVMVMGVQYFFINMTGIQVFTTWLILDGFWFLVNVMGVIRFLARTFDYLRPEQRANIQLAYTINYVWPLEMRCNLEHNFFHGAIDYGWLPGPGFGADGHNSNTAVLIHSFGQDKGDIQVTDQKKDKWFIHDVRFRPLSLAIKSWQRREEKLALSQINQPDVITGQSQPRVIILPCAPGTQFDASYGLCRTDGGDGLRWWERWLVRWSFVLARKEKKTAPLSISDILDGLITDVQVTMEASEEMAFRDTLKELVDTHAAVIQAGDFIKDAGRRDNYANLTGHDDFFGNRLHDLWIREYHRLLTSSVDKLSVSDTYFKQMVYVPGWLVSRLETTRPIDIPARFLRLSESLHYLLNRWWSRTVEQQGLLDHSPCRPVILKAPAFAIYDAAIKEHVGAWESLKYKFLPTRKAFLTWERYGEISRLYSGHLNCTLNMLFDNLSIGNKEGAEWLCDSLIKWWDTISFRYENIRYYIRDKHMLTLGLMQKPWEKAKNVIDISSPTFNESNAPRALWAACIHNYWTDMCCVSLYTLMRLGKVCECDKSLPAHLAGSLGRGAALRAGGERIGKHWPIQSLEDLLIAIIRQYYFDGGYSRGYRARLDGVVERILDRGEPDRVPYRIYSGSGTDDLEALSDGQLVLLCLFIKKNWTPPTRLMEMIQKLGGANDASLRGFKDQLNQWKSRLGDANFQEYKHLFSCIQMKFDAIENFEDATVAPYEGLDQLINGIEGFRNEQLREAQVSEDRLKEVAKWSSRWGFSDETGGVPVSLFRKVQYSTEEYTEYSLIFRDMDKGEFIEPPMAQRASSEEEWFGRAVNDHVAGSVMASILRALNVASMDVDDPIAYWKQIKFAASIIREKNDTPILFIAGPAEPHWLLDWMTSEYDDGIGQPEDLRLMRYKQFESSNYVINLNDIPAYVAPISAGSSYLLPKEALDTLRFTKFEDDVFVKASTQPIQGKDMLVNLKLAWRFELDLKPSECWRLHYIQSSET